MRSALLAPIALMTVSGCGTLVQVVDAQGAPVSGAQVCLDCRRFNDSMTDSDGYARIKDSWLWFPVFSSRPAWVRVTKAGEAWLFGYPPSSVLRLDESHLEKPEYQLEASQHS